MSYAEPIDAHEEHQVAKAGRRAARHHLHNDQYQKGRQAAIGYRLVAEDEVKKMLDHHRGRKGAYHRGFADELASYLQ